jgi:hypothetical protein
MVIFSNIVRPFGIFQGIFLFSFPRFLVCFSKKNLATLSQTLSERNFFFDLVCFVVLDTLQKRGGGGTFTAKTVNYLSKLISFSKRPGKQFRA